MWLPTNCIQVTKKLRSFFSPQTNLQDDLQILGHEFSTEKILFVCSLPSEIIYLLFIFKNVSVHWMEGPKLNTFHTNLVGNGQVGKKVFLLD